MKPDRGETGEQPSAGAGAPARAWQSAFLRRFVGREDELDRFRVLLEEPSDPAAVPDDRTSPVAVLALHGPGGIGKTTLLRRFAVEAEQRGRHVVEVDAERTEPTERAFAAAADVAGTGRLVLLVDAADHLGSLENWFRDRFLTRLAPGSLVVLAGRRPPSLRWRTDPAWYDTLRVVPLEGLSPAGSARLLRDTTTGPTADWAARLAFADGHPLALRLVGSDRGDGPPGEWQPSPHVVEDLLNRVVGPVPSPVHRRALEICAHLTEVTEDLLRVLLPDHAHEMFDWMRRQPYATSHRNGLRLLPVVVRALDRDLRWRAPDSYLSMHKAVRAHLHHLLRSRPEPASLRAAAAYNHIQTGGRWLPGFDWSDRDDRVRETTCDAEDVPPVRALMREELGAESEAALDFWLHRRPGGFRVYRSVRSGEVVGFLGLLNFDRWDAVETAIDPVVASVRDHVEAGRELRPGRRVQLVRFLLVRRRSADRPAALAGMLARITRELLSEDRLEWTFHASGPDDWTARLLKFADFRRLPRGPLLAERAVTLFGRDWGAMGVSEWSDLLDDRMLFGLRTSGITSLPRTSVLSKASFDRAVHDALRAWHQRERLTANPLLHAAFVASRSGDPEDNLRTLILRAIEAIDQDPKAKLQKAAVRETYVEGGSTQQAVARELSLSFSTYRRYLKQGIARVSWQLWKQELTQAALAATSSWTAPCPPGHRDRPAPAQPIRAVSGRDSAVKGE
ncbi:ATP-binding protein [Streptomyces sp. NPDC060002]|uniref:ATP-binding protein n=1 Tax=Streptomyces sp. NPDC060002 TaxID=3347033 RepID=UPI00368588A5